MNRPKFEPIFSEKSDFCEKCSSKAVASFVPNQAITLKELVARFERGQRLNVHANFPAGSNFENITDEESLNRLRSESMDTADFPPEDVHDVVDVQRHYEENQIHKREFKARIKEKRKQAQQAKQQKQAQQAKQTPTPPVPPSE